MNGNILVVDDNGDINNIVTQALTQNGYKCTQAYSGTEALLCFKQEKYDLVILDLMMPGLCGEDFIKKIKPQSTVPVIVLSAKDELDSKVELLNLGAEDYMTKPFEIKELLARVAVQMRRSSANVSEVLQYKNLILCREAYSVSISGDILPLTKQEFKILELLLTYPRRVFSKQDIYNYAWDDYFMGEDKTINVHISNIRQKLKKLTEEEYIETVWGIGFKLAE